MIEPNNAAHTIKDVVVHETGRGRFQLEVVWGAHHLTVTIPAKSCVLSFGTQFARATRQ